MRLLIQSAMIFFGTLLAAALVALGEPRAASSLATPRGGESGPPPELQGGWLDAAAPAGR